MADDTNFTSSQGRPEGGSRGHRQGGGRDAGGFRIRLSDNELQAARALQEAFNLRSTVAVLGFAVRSLAQLLEEGKLDELVAQQRAQGGGRPPGPRGERRGERDRSASGATARTARVDPFARPSRPAPAAAAEPDEESAAPEDSELTANGVDVAPDAVPEADSAAAADESAPEATSAS